MELESGAGPFKRMLALLRCLVGFSIDVLSCSTFLIKTTNLRSTPIFYKQIFYKQMLYQL